MLCLFGIGCAKTEEDFSNLLALPVSSDTVKIELPEPVGGFALSVGSETITCSQIINPTLMQRLEPLARKTSLEVFKKQARPLFEQLVINKITEILLYSRAKTELGEKTDEALEKAAETETRRFVLNFGGDYARAEHALRQMNMDWEQFREHQKKMMLSQYYVSSKVSEPAPASYSDLLGEYNKVKKELFTIPAMLRFRLIDIDIAKLRPADPNQSRKEAAGDLSSKLIKLLNDGEDFAALAEQYSHGHRRSFGGLWNAVQPDSLAYPYDVLASLARDIKPGQIAGPVEAGGHIFIMKLEDKRSEGVEPFEKVQTQLEAKIRLERRKHALDKFGQSIVEQAQVANKDAFVGFCMEQVYEKCNQ